MQALYRTRSRHFVSSPRKAATPLKHRLLRHESKRRKLGANTALALDNTSSDSDTPRRPRGSKSRRDVFSTEESPKKRKREEDEGSETSGSWIEMEEEPEFIAESDQHLLEDAPLYALQRLRKAELVRLWKVAGMWPDEYTDEEISKKELVDGLIARRPSRDTLDEAEPTEPMVSFRTEVTPRAKHMLKTIRRKSRRRGRNIGRFEVKSLESQSSQSSFTTTDTSPPADPPRRTLRLGRRRVVESIEVVEESESENETPLVHRLRSRTRSSFKDSSDIEADGEDSEHERLPDRGAKRKAIEALKGGESDDAMDLTMDPVTEDTKDLADATQASLLRLLRDDLVQMCEARGIEVEGTKPQLAQALLDWRDRRSTSSQSTARPDSSTIIHAVASNVHESGKTTPVLLRDHVHAHDPATPARSDTDSKKTGEAELNLDLSELGLEDSMIKPSQLQKLEKIGSGGFKDVYIGKLRGRKVAISEFREHLSEMDIRELKLLAEFSHPNIVKFRGICIPEDNSQVPCMLVSELCENGDLFDYIRNVPCPPLKRVLELMLDIARGLEYLHTRKPAIIHRDCKSSNILINRAGQAKVGDFGLARVKHSTRSMIRSLVGTVNWQAPELWHPAPRYDYKVDVFSAAVVYWEMMSGWIGEKKYPWEGFNEHYIYDAVGQKQQRPSVDGLREYWGEEPVKLMERMWHQDPGERPTMTDVVVDLEVLVGEC